MSDFSPEIEIPQERILPQDIFELRQYYKDILPVDKETYQQAGNVDLQAAAAQKIAQSIPGADPLEAQLLYYANSIRKLPNSDTISMPPSAIKLFEKIQRLHSLHPTSDIQTLSPLEASIEIAQFIGTRNFQDWSIQPLSIPEGYRNIQTFLTKKGIDLNAVRSEITEEEKKRSPEVVLWDVGGVFITNPGKDIINAFSEQLNIPQPELLDFLDKKDPKTGQLDHSYPSRKPYFSDDEQIMEGFWNELQRLYPDKYIDRSAIIAGFEKTKYPDMQALLDTLKKHYRVAILSDTMPPHMQLLWEHGVYKGFEKVMLSPVIHSSKGLGTEAFNIATADLGVPPWSIVFVDDSQSNINNADQAHLKTVQFLHTDNPESVENLKTNLQAQGVAIPTTAGK